MDVYSATTGFAVPRETLSARFEDGTVDFLGIAALAAGFDALDRVSACLSPLTSPLLS